MTTTIQGRSITVPFTIVIDTREQLPFEFTGLLADAKQHNRPLTIRTVRSCLRCGDYSIIGHERSVAVERKSPADLFNTLGQHRKRFTRRLAELSADYKFAAVIVECEWWQILNDPPRHSKLPPKNVYRSVIAYQQQWPGVHWWMCPSRRFAEITTFRILERYWKCQATLTKASRPFQPDTEVCNSGRD